jgi:hypothetical protein
VLISGALWASWLISGVSEKKDASTPCAAGD